MSDTVIPPVRLSPANLTVAKENTYFVWVLIVSILAWLGLALTIVGLLYALLFGVFLWLGNGLLVAYLRAEAVRVTERQMPELHRAFVDVCARLGLRQVPGLYVLQSGGLLNAFATRHTGRDFVVVYSDLLEALGPDSPEMRFLLGHEIGHLKSRHILKQVFLAPGLFFPLVGPAYRRAWETSCDRYGAFAAQDVGAATRGLLVLAGGREHGRRIDAAAYAGQYAQERGFFVSLHELTSTYPTLSRRVTDVMALADGAPPPRAPRHPLAYLLGLFMPGGGAGSASPAGAMMMIVVIGLLAAMAIPAFQKVRQASQEKACVNNQRMFSAAFDQYRLENGKGAETWDDIVGPDKYIRTMPACIAGGEYSANYDEVQGYLISCSVHGSGHAGAPASHR
ncbi:MAG: M48 family metalloprotease [Candidatus Didemnitutus sp.]|nr:M48 family metalloprotease [Candidatus Didemnitutus sp.]